MRAGLLMLGLLLALAACGEERGPYHVYTPPLSASGQMCADQCTQSHNYCYQSCGLDYRSCINDVQAIGAHDYEMYVKTRFDAHEKVEKQPSDFEHPGACAVQKKKCLSACDDPYNTCYGACGGTVTTVYSCQSFCFK
ncbi:MAG: hypothetical protein KGI97_00780 [Alphaproteobacteria bacterium]|nr:hypothetical protein [Alphaproteobacteria bacterium]